jgi:hypothetical protein
MGTRGLYVFKYQGLYYIFYNHWDSYPSGGLGDTIVAELKTLDFEKVRELVSAITVDHIAEIGEGHNFISLMDALKNPENFALLDISKEEPDCTYDAEYTYIMDLDKTIFKVISNYGSMKFKLTDIPSYWVDLVLSDED